MQDGSNWSSLGSGIDGSVIALTVYDDKLIAGGYSTTAGGVPANFIASWDGTFWSALGAETDSRVQALTEYNDELMVGGNFMMAGNKVAVYLVAWTKHDPTGVEDQNRTTLPDAFSLVQNYPNPFNPTTTIEYSIPTRAHVTVEILNLLRQHVKMLIDETNSAGNYKVEWNGTDVTGRVVSTGVYLHWYGTGDFVETKKMLLLK